MYAYMYVYNTQCTCNCEAKNCSDVSFRLRSEYSRWISKFILTTDEEPLIVHRSSFSVPLIVHRSVHRVSCIVLACIVHRSSYIVHRASFRLGTVCAPCAFRLRVGVESKRNHNCNFGITSTCFDLISYKKTSRVILNNYKRREGP